MVPVGFHSDASRDIRDDWFLRWAKTGAHTHWELKF